MELRKVSSPLFLLALLCFFLPFVKVSCQGQPVASFTGVQLATGTDLTQPGTGIFGQRQNRRIPADVRVLLTALCAIAGAFVGRLRLGSRAAAAFSAVAAVTGVVSLFLLKSKTDGEVLSQGGGVLQVEYGLGFVLVCLLLLAAAGLNAMVYSQEGRSMPPPVPAGTTPDADRNV